MVGYLPLQPMADKISAAPSETVSPENKRFSELIESGKYGKILKDPKTGDVAVVFGDNQSVKLSAEEVRTSRPEYGSEKNPVDTGSYVSPTGEPFSPRIESRPMASAEILEAARAKFEKAHGGATLREGVPKLLSEYGVALEENGKKFRLVDSGSGGAMEFAIEGKTAYERQKKAAQLFLVVGKAMETMRTCEARHPLMAECRAYSSVDPIASYGYRELKIDDKLFGDTVVASGEELAGLTSAERRNFAEKLAPFVNGVFKARYVEIVRK
ncbi:MAG: hypothetical protein QG650_275, partial [Patescibacteria group bacterium]|nr:hypothetical protein [Patescibacteria group bacterium]